MAKAPITFRCYRCNQPLGAPARKAGSVVNCPQCGSELKIPVPDADATATATASALPPDLATLRPEDIRVEPEFAHIVVAPARPRPGPDPPSTTTDVVEDGDDPPETITIEAGEQVVIPSIRVDPPSIAAADSPSRGVREVVLSPAVVLAWSLLVLLAIPLAFLAGLLTGHFVWR